MAKKTVITVAQLQTSVSAKFFQLPRRLTAKFVREFFREAVAELGAKPVSAAEIRKKTGNGDEGFVHSFLCYTWKVKVPFLQATKLMETHYGFMLLVERDGHLAVFYRGMGGFEKRLAKITQPIPRQKLTHAWSSGARYQKLGTRRMTISHQELRGASYDADDLEAALPPAVAARSTCQSLRLNVTDYGVVAITPSTGRVQKAGGKAVLGDLIEFIDETIEQVRGDQVSPFLSAFPAPLELSDLPGNVTPTGLLFDLSALLDAMVNAAPPWELKRAPDAPAAPLTDLYAALSQVMDLTKNADEEWEAKGANGTIFATIKRLKHAYGVSPTGVRDWVLDNGAGETVDLARWLKSKDAFSLSFSEPDYFYTAGNLYLRKGFKGEAELVLRMLQVHAPLDPADSEKGSKDDYDEHSVHFVGTSIFRVLETSLAAGTEHLCCCDLGDEWADYLGFDPKGVTFYHCKDGTPTTGASDFQIVVGQALKNLSRIRFRTEEIRTKLMARKDREFWGATRIPLLVHANGGWDGLIQTAVSAAGKPDTAWRVALVVTALARSDFVAEMAKPNPTPHFIQLVWLLSAFASECRERGAEPVIYTRT